MCKRLLNICWWQARCVALVHFFFLFLKFWSFSVPGSEASSFSYVIIIGNNQWYEGWGWIFKLETKTFWRSSSQCKIFFALFRSQLSLAFPFPRAFSPNRTNFLDRKHLWGGELVLKRGAGTLKNRWYIYFQNSFFFFHTTSFWVAYFFPE